MLKRGGVGREMKRSETVRNLKDGKRGRTPRCNGDMETPREEMKQKRGKKSRKRKDQWKKG